MPSARDYFMTTQRLGFRFWRETDFALAAGLWGDPRVARWIDARGQLADEQVRERLAGEIQCQQDHGIQYWPFFRRETGGHVGCCGLRPYDPAQRVYELGFHVCAHSWRQGYAREAARAVITHAFDTHRAAALFAGHHPRNKASRRLLTRLGFQYTHDEYYAATGAHHPSYRLEAAGPAPQDAAEAASRTPDKKNKVIRIEEEPVALYKILKLANVVQSGGEAKYRIAGGDVRLNGEIETRKRKKIVSGDRIEFAGQIYQIKVQRSGAP